MINRWSDVRLGPHESIGGLHRHGERPPLVLLHGFTQTGRSWLPIVDHLPSGIEVFLPDAPGHGSSSECRVGIAEYSEILADSLPPAVYVGYSMGGRTALHVASRRPEAVMSLVLVGASPGIDDPTERRERRRRDDELADRLESMDLDDFLDEWLSQALFSSLPRENWNLDDRRRNTETGLASSLRIAGTGAQDSLWGDLGRISCPTTLVTGSNDTKFGAVASRMVALLGGPSRHIALPSFGHAAHLEDPLELAALIEEIRSELT